MDSFVHSLSSKILFRLKYSITDVANFTLGVNITLLICMLVVFKYVVGGACIAVKVNSHQH